MIRHANLRPNGRRAWGVLLVTVVLASGFLAAIGVSEKAMETYRLHKVRADRRAMRAAASSALGLVAAHPERWLDSAFGASEAVVGDCAARISASAMPEGYGLPSSPDVAYRLIRLDVSPLTGANASDAVARVGGGRLAAKSQAQVKVTRLYAAAYQEGQPLRLLFLEERFSSVQPPASSGGSF